MLSMFDHDLTHVPTPLAVLLRVPRGWAGFGGDGHEAGVQVQDELVELVNGVVDVQRE